MESVTAMRMQFSFAKPQEAVNFAAKLDATGWYGECQPYDQGWGAVVTVVITAEDGAVDVWADLSKLLADVNRAEANVEGQIGVGEVGDEF